MEIGMLWNDDDGRRTLAEKVARAAEYYQSKYGETPTLCYVHPSLLPADTEPIFGLRLLAARTVQVNYFWLGVSGATEMGHAKDSHKKASAR